ncbi:MAG: molybdenum cofactor guanylyltransferase [Solirubrobacterales bacterium]
MGEGKRSDVLGAVLAGGAASRMDGGKAGALLGERPLIEYPVGALQGWLADVAVVAKADTALPALPNGVSRIDEPAEPRHPMTGVVAALGAAGGRPVLVLACDLPLVGEATVDALLAEPAGGSMVIAAAAQGRVQPLMARYEAGALPGLAGFDPAASATSLALGLGASLVAVPDREATGVNDAAELEELSRRWRSSSGPAG